MFWLCKKNCTISSQKFNEIPGFKKFLLNKRWLFSNLNDSIWIELPGSTVANQVSPSQSDGPGQVKIMGHKWLGMQ
jgi:hypothetical protein